MELCKECKYWKPSSDMADKRLCTMCLEHRIFTIKIISLTVVATVIATFIVHYLTGR